jgi:lipopolysaccharide export system protein LptC
MNSTTKSKINHSAGEALGLWEPKRTLTLESARRHSLFIKMMRRVLIGLCLCLSIFLVYEFATQGNVTFIEDNPTEAVKMINPRYSGRTNDGLPFYLKADLATRKMKERDVVSLIKPVLEFTREKGAEVSILLAETGTFNDIEKILNLKSGVSLKTDDGYECTTTHARIFNKEKRIEGKEYIQCNGNFGEVTGNAFEINNNYSQFVFKNGVTAAIEQDSAISTIGESR